MPEESKWRRFPLKSRWYDDQFGNGATRGEVIENQLDDRLLHNDEEDVASREVEAFFDLFEEPGG